MSDEDDNALWDIMTRDVEKIARERPLAKPPDRQTKVIKQTGEQKKVSDKVVDENVFKQGRSQDPGLGLDRKTAERLRKGQIPIEGRLDLHGCNRQEAYALLSDFIMKAHSQGKRCVLVITGKGAGVDGRRDPLVSGRGVLKRSVPEWLAQAPLKTVVLKYQTARGKDGGEGALYVLLRRQR